MIHSSIMGSKGCSVGGIARALMLFALTISLCPTECPANGFHSFESIIGYWYVVATSGANGESLYKCASLNITKEGISVAFTFTGIRLPYGEPIISHGMIRPDGNNRAWWWLTDGDTETNGSLKFILIPRQGFVVIILDDIQYLGYRLHKSGAILSRTKSLKLEDLLSSREELDPHFNDSDIYEMGQFNCNLRLTCKQERIMASRGMQWRAFLLG